MLALCNHTLPIVACTVDRKRLRVFCVHDTKSFNMFKKAYDNILNDDNKRKPVLLVAGIQLLKTLINANIDLSPFVICLFASCKKVSAYDGIEVLDMDDNNNPVTLKIAEINKAFYQAEPGIPALYDSQKEAEAPKDKEVASLTNLAVQFRENLIGSVKNRELTMRDFNQLVKAYHNLLKEVNVAGTGKTVFEEADKYSKDTPLQDMISYAVTNFILSENAELAINKIIVRFIFSNTDNGLSGVASLAKELHQWLPSKYSVRLAKEVARRRPGIRKAFYLTKNEMTIRKALERTKVRPEDLLLAYTFYPKQFK